MKTILEVCCGSYGDVLAAKAGGGDRVELNSALSAGGLTPGMGMFMKAKTCGLPIICMVRPRGSGFQYDQQDQETMFAEAELFLKQDAAGIAFGFLHADFTIDVEASGRMINLIHTYGKTAVFHRAFDCLNDMEEGIKQLISLGADRVLTSGLCATAEHGINHLRYLQAQYGTQIEILAGGGVRPCNAALILQKTGVCQLHSSCKTYFHDPTGENNGISYATYKDGAYEVVDQNQVRELKKEMERTEK